MPPLLSLCAAGNCNEGIAKLNRTNDESMHPQRYPLGQRIIAAAVIFTLAPLILAALGWTKDARSWVRHDKP